jgi:hypothetical protein
VRFCNKEHKEKGKKYTSTSVMKESSQEETCVKEELKIKRKEIKKRIKEEAYKSSRKKNDK